jgi:type II secretory pathway pseudopilin PulG
MPAGRGEQETEGNSPMDTERSSSPRKVPIAGRRARRPLFRGRILAVHTAIVLLFLGLLAANVGPRYVAAAQLGRRQGDLVRQLAALRMSIDRYKQKHGMYPDLSGSFDALVSGGESAPLLTAAPVNPISQSAAVSTAATAGNGWLYGGTSGAEAGTVFALDLTGKTLDF